MDQEGRAAVVPPERERHHGARPRCSSTTRCRSSSPSTATTPSSKAATAWCRRPWPPWRLHRPQRGADALLRQHRRLRRRRHHGRHLGHGVLVRPDRQRSPVRRRRHRRRAGAAAGQPHIIEDNCFIGARSEVVEGVVVENSVLAMGVFLSQAPRSMTAPPARSPTAACRRARWWCRARCLRRRFAQSGLRRDRQARRRADARQDQHQRPAEGLMSTSSGSSPSWTWSGPDRPPVCPGRRGLPGDAGRAPGTHRFPLRDHRPGRRRQPVGAARKRRPWRCSPATRTRCRRARARNGRATRSRRPSATVSCTAAARRHEARSPPSWWRPRNSWRPIRSTAARSRC